MIESIDMSNMEWHFSAVPGMIQTANRPTFLLPPRDAYLPTQSKKIEE